MSQTNGRTENEKHCFLTDTAFSPYQSCLPYSVLMRIYIMLDYHYTNLWILHCHTQNSIISDISPVNECSIYFV